MCELLTAGELAERLRIKPSTVSVWARAGRIPSIKLSRKVIRFDVVAVIDALTNRAEAVQ